MLLDGDIYGQLFQKWVIPNEDEDIPFGITLKPDAPPKMKNLFNQLQNEMRNEVRRRSRYSNKEER
jgi:hypothetical protein